MPSDSSAVDTALLGKLNGDATLTAFGGTYWDEAPDGSTAFVIVSLVNEDDIGQFGGRSYEDALYLVKAVALSTATGKDVKAAAARIDVLLEGGTLTPTGYTLMTMQRESRVRYTEVDEADASIRWQHRGGRYQVAVSL